MKKRDRSIIPGIKEMKKHIRSRGRVVRLIYIVLTALVVITMLRSLIRGEYAGVPICFLTLTLFMLPAIVEKNFRLYLPRFFEGTVLIFIFAAEILGEINSYYQKIPHWDTVLHTVNGFMFAAFGFALLDMINRDGKIKFKLSPLYLSLVAFCFSMTVGVFWEFFEFGADQFFHTDMQKDTYLSEIYTLTLDAPSNNAIVSLEKIDEISIHSGNGETTVLHSYLDIGLVDTMEDLIVNCVGAFCFSVIGFFFLKNKGRGRLAGQFIPRLLEQEENHDFLAE